jgi:TatD DNase family protein
MIDTHAHLDDEQFDGDREEVIARSFENGVEKIINVGADLGGSRASIELAKKYENIFATVGLHPHCFGEAEEAAITKKQETDKSQITKTRFEKEIEKIKILTKDKNVVAIGEIGLDYFSHNGKVITGEQKENQKKGFIAQLEIAKENNLPAIIHCRASKENSVDAYEDLYQIIQNSKFKIQNLVFHCYGGDLDFTKKLLQHKNIYFSFTPNITYKIKKEVVGTKDDIAESIKIIPLEKIMLETDCPYLAPREFRGQRSEPMYIKYTAEKIASIKNVSIDKVKKNTSENAKDFFRF